jgi:hypothetical protein
MLYVLVNFILPGRGSAGEGEYYRRTLIESMVRVQTVTLLAVIVLFLLISWTGASFHVQGYNVLTPVQKRWWMDTATALEPFMNPSKEGKGGKGEKGGKENKKEENEEVADSSPGKPAPVDLYHMEPYLLLSDILIKGQESPSSVTSQSCYTMDAEAYLSKVGNYRQLTNNYKREYPDHCSSPFQEFILPFYKPKPLVPSSVAPVGASVNPVGASK